MTLHAIADEVHAEIHRAWNKFGPQYELPDGTGAHMYRVIADVSREATDQQAAAGKLTWLDILMEEAYEAFAEGSTAALRAELVQVAAVAMRWIDAIDQRAAAPEDSAS